MRPAWLESYWLAHNPCVDPLFGSSGETALQSLQAQASLTFLPAVYGCNAAVQDYHQLAVALDAIALVDWVSSLHTGLCDSPALSLFSRCKHRKTSGGVARCGRGIEAVRAATA